MCIWIHNSSSQCQHGTEYRYRGGKPVSNWELNMHLSPKRFYQNQEFGIVAQYCCLIEYCTWLGMTTTEHNYTCFQMYMPMIDFWISLFCILHNKPDIIKQVLLSWKARTVVFKVSSRISWKLTRGTPMKRQVHAGKFFGKSVCRPQHFVGWVLSMSEWATTGHMVDSGGPESRP